MNKIYKCSVADCNYSKNRFVKGMCITHYYQKKRNSVADSESNQCYAPGCEKNKYGNGLCALHYKRDKRHGHHSILIHKKDGQTKNPLYTVHRKMKERCYSENCPEYEDYGGRGITVCDEWLGVDGFTNFYNFMGDKPSSNHTLDRIDNNKGYSPDNCKWSTKQEQAQNRRVRKDSRIYPNIREYKGGRYLSYGYDGNAQIHLGIFNDIEDAISNQMTYNNCIDRTQ